MLLRSSKVQRIHSFTERFVSETRIYIMNCNSQITQKENHANHIMHISNAGTNWLHKLSLLSLLLLPEIDLFSVFVICSLLSLLLLPTIIPHICESQNSCTRNNTTGPDLSSQVCNLHVSTIYILETIPNITNPEIWSPSIQFQDFTLFFQTRIPAICFSTSYPWQDRVADMLVNLKAKGLNLVLQPSWKLPVTVFF